MSKFVIQAKYDGKWKWTDRWYNSEEEAEADLTNAARSLKRGVSQLRIIHASAEDLVANFYDAEQLLYQFYSLMEAMDTMIHGNERQKFRKLLRQVHGHVTGGKPSKAPLDLFWTKAHGDVCDALHVLLTGKTVKQKEAAR